MDRINIMNISTTLIDYSKVFFVIPAFNEEGVVDRVISEIQQKGPQIVVVDDCSTDDTYERCVNSGAWVVRHSVNLGQGAALQTGISFALKHSAEIIVTFDSDGQHRVQDAMKMIETLVSEELDVLLGSRFLGVRPVGMPKERLFLLKLAVIFTRLSSRVKVTDSHNGLRVMTRYAADTINLTHNRMAHASEILTQIHKKRLRYSEYPVQIVYTTATLRKGQRSSNLFSILFELLMGRFR
jgi:glycosyltransferase involved in cell wall biosynthesis